MLKYLDLLLAALLFAACAVIFSARLRPSAASQSSNLDDISFPTSDKRYVIRTADGTCVGRFHSAFLTDTEAETLAVEGEFGLKLAGRHAAFKLDATLTFNLAHQMVGALATFNNEQGSLFLGLLGVNPMQSTLRITRGDELVLQRRFELPGPVQGRIEQDVLHLSHPLLPESSGSDSESSPLMKLLLGDLERPRLEEAPDTSECPLEAAGLPLDQLQQRLQGLSSLFPAF